MNTVFIAPGYLSHYATLFRGRFIEHLSSQHRVIVLTRDMELADAERRGYYTGHNMVYERVPFHQKLLWDIFDAYIRLAFAREHDFSVVNRSWWYKKSHPIEKRILNHIGGIFPSRWMKSEYMTALERFFARPSPRFRSLVERYRPSLLITATPGISPYETELIHYAKSLGVPQVAIDMNFDHPEGMSKFLRKTDYVGAWSERMKRQSEVYQRFAPDRIKVIGCLRFDHFFNLVKEGKVRSREEFLISKRLNPRKKTLSYFTSTPISYPPRREFMEGFIGLKQKKLLSGDPNIFVRLHPHDLWAPYEPFKNIPEVHIERAGTLYLDDQQETKGWKVDMTAEDYRNTTETFLYTDLLINYSSTTTIEAAIFGKDTIGIYYPASVNQFFNYEQEEHQFSVNAGVLSLARSLDELKNLINLHLDGNKTGDKDRHRRVVEYFMQFTDGRNWERAVQWIDEIIARESGQGAAPQ